MKNKSILTKKSLEEYVEYAKYAFDTRGEVEPIFFFNLEGKVVPLTTGILFEAYDKKFVLSAVKEYYVQKYHRVITEVVFICEAWYLKTGINKKVDYNQRPSESPDRKEAVFIIGRNDSGKYVSKCYDIDRANKKLVENEETEGSEFVGLLDYIFDPAVAKMKEEAVKPNKIIN